MPTRFYLPSTGAAPVSPAFNTSWDENASADRLKCVRSRINSAMTDKVVAKATTATRALVRQYVSDQIEAQTIAAGTVKGQIRALESAANDNLDLVPLSIRIVSADGNTYRTPALVALGDYAAASEFATTLTNRRIADGDTTTEVVAEDGDRIVIEIGIKNSATGASVSGTLNFGDDNATTDLGENTTDTSAFNPWVELSQTIAFKVARTAPSNVVGIPDSTTEIDWSWTRGASDNTDVEWQLNGGGWTALGSPTQTTLTTSGLSPGVSYTLEVRNKWATDTPLSSIASGVASTYALDGWSDNLNSQQAPLKSLTRLSQIVDTGSTTGNLGFNTANEAEGQSFTATATGKLIRFRFTVTASGTPTDSVICRLYDDNSGLPGTLLATSLPLAASAIIGANTASAFDFPVPPSVVSGTVYHAILWRTGSLSTSNFYTLVGGDTNPYAGGQHIRRANGAWVAHSTEDMVFHAEVEGVNWYKFEIDREAFKLRAYKSTDVGANWAEQDAANAPTILEGVGLFTAAVQRKGEKLYVVILTTLLQLKSTYPFSTTTDTWGSPTTVTLPVPLTANVSGAVPLYHNYREFSNQATKQTMVYGTQKQESDDQWYRKIATPAFLTGSGVLTHYDLRAATTDWRDWFYAFYTKSDSTQIQVATLAVNDIAWTVVGGLSVSAVDQTAKYPLGQGCNFWRDGVNYVGVMYKDGSTVKFLYCESGTAANTAGNWLSSTIASVAPESDTSNPGFVVADNEQGGKLFAFFVDDSTGDLMWCHDDGSFTWSEPEFFYSAGNVAGCAGTLSDGVVGMLLRDSSTFELIFKTFDVFF